MSETYPWEQYPLHELEARGIAMLGRGNIISKKDMQSNPGGYPIYSSSAKGEGLFGTYGDYMFDEEMITWSVDGGGNLFHRPRHKFSVTNVSGYMRLDTSALDYRFAHAALALQHSKLTFDYQTKAHPSVIRNLYHLPIPPLPEQKKIAEILSGIDKRKETLKSQREKLQTAYKAFSRELLGSLSTKLPLSDICDLQVGFPFRSADFSETGVRLLRGENVGYGTPNWERAQFLPNSLAEASSVYQVNAGDIVIGMDRSFTKSGFKVSRISSADLPCLLVQRVGRFTPKSISSKFLWHILQSPDYQRVLLSSEKGMDIPHLSKGEILEPLVPVADTSTQAHISNSLDSILKSIRSIDASITATSQLGAALQSDLLSGRKRFSV